MFRVIEYFAKSLNITQGHLSTITSTSSALRRLVELRQAATSDEIRRTGVFTFWSSGMESTSRAHQTTVVSLCF